MSARSTGWVKVVITETQWLEVSGITLKDLEEEAIKVPGVVAILQTRWSKPDD